MTAAEERAALVHYAELRDEHGADHKLSVAARNRIITHNMRLVGRVANRLRGLTYEDRVQEGVLGLIRALEKFDPSRGLRFSTYAAHWIRHAIQRAIDDKGDTVRIPVAEAARRKRAARSGEDIRDGLSIECPGFSLDVALGPNEGSTWHDVLHGDAEPADERLARLEREDAVRGAVAELDDGERAIVVARYGLDGRDEQTLTEVGAKLKRARETVRGVEREAIAKVREWVA